MTADSGGEGHVGPAVVDPPRGFGEASWWPLVTALGAAGLYLGVALTVLGTGPEAVMHPLVGPAVIVPAAVLLVAGLVGWLYHAFVADWVGAVSHGGGQGRALRLGMVLFLSTEVGTFGGPLVYYGFVRTGDWTALPAVVTTGELLGPLVLANSVVLVASSGTLHLAHGALRRGNRRRFLGLLATTVVLGLGFLAGQAYEYYEFLVHEGFTVTAGVFGSAFYALTGIHGLHVALGVVVLAIVLVRGRAGQLSADHHTSVTTAAMYWHFVDAVWVLLVVALYAGAIVSG